MPSIVTPTFDETLPVNTIVEPTNTFEWSEAEYVSTLKNAARDWLKDQVDNGGTGLGSAVQADIWALRSERDEVAKADRIDEAKSVWSATGFNLPSGVIASQIDEVFDDHKNMLTDRSRDIAIEEAKLAQTNTHFAVQNALALEQMELTHAGNVADRALRGASALVQFSIELFKAKIANYNTNIERYKAAASVYDALIRSELIKVEIYKAQIEGAKLEAQVQMQLVDIYKAQIDAVNSILTAYKTEMEAVGILAGIEKIKIDRFKAQVDAFAATIGAKQSEYEGYKAAIQGETAKVESFEAEARAYTAEMAGKSAQAQVEGIRVGALIEIEKLRMEDIKVQLDRYRSQAQAAISKVNALVSFYQGEIQSYNVSVQKAS